MLRTRTLAPFCLVALLAACGSSDGPTPAGDTGTGDTDTGGGDVSGDADAGTDTTDPDADAGTDTSDPDADAGTDTTDPDATDATDASDATDTTDPDASDAGDGSGDGGTDGGTDASDTGSDATDTGSDATDTGSDATDTGSDTTDTGSDATDTGSDTTDTGPTCPNGVREGLEECDDGADNSDRIPNACRTDCTLPICGDGVVDDEFDEACDDGDLNADDAPCTSLCQVNLAAACSDVADVVLLADVAGFEDGVLRFSGDLSTASNDDAPSDECADWEGLNYGDALLIFVPEEDGDYVVSTEEDETTDTIVTVYDDCVDGVALACNDNAVEGARGARVLLEALTAGTPVYISVDSFFGSGSYTVTISRAEALLGRLEPCDFSGQCEAGFACVERDGAGRCEQDEAPVITEITSERIEENLVLHRIRGTDVNRDPFNVLLGAIELEDGTIIPDLGYGLSEPPQDFIVDGDTFEFSFAFDWEGFVVAIDEATGEEGPAVTIELAVTDSRGDASEFFASDIPPFVEIDPIAEGEPCDPDGFGGFCDEGLVCLPDGDGGFACSTGTAPIISEVTVEWLSNTLTRHTYVGVDLDEDVTRELISNLGGPVTLNFGLDDVEYADGGAFVAYSDISIGAGAPPPTMTSGVGDAAGNASNQIAITYPARPTPTTLPAGAVCDPTDFFVRCAAPNVCSVDGDGFVCAAAQAPVLRSFEATEPFPGEAVSGLFAGSDANGDVVTVRIQFIDPEGTPYGLNLPATNTEPAINGLRSFLAETGLIGTGFALSDMCITLIDSAGLTSETLCDSLAEEGGPGDLCSYDGSEGACDDALGLACGVDGTCEDAVPPTIEDASAVWITDDIALVTIDGADLNGDVTRWQTYLYDADGAALTGTFTFSFDGDPRGFTTFTASTDISGLSTFPTLDGMAVRLLDSASLTSDWVFLDLPEIVGDGEACDPDGITSICAIGLVCNEGTCGTDLESPCGPIALLDLFADGVDEGSGAWSIAMLLPDSPSYFEGDCAGDGGEAAFAFSVDTSTAVLITTVGGSEADTVLNVTAGVCLADPADAEYLTCNDDDDLLDSDSFQSSVAFRAEPETTYYVIVDQWDGEEAGEVNTFVLLSTIVGLGEECDLEGFASVCDVELTCADVDGTGICGEADPAGSCSNPIVIEDEGIPVEPGVWGILVDATTGIETYDQPCNDEPDTVQDVVIAYTITALDPDGFPADVVAVEAYGYDPAVLPSVSVMTVCGEPASSDYCVAGALDGEGGTIAYTDLIGAGVGDTVYILVEQPASEVDNELILIVYEYDSTSFGD